MKRILKTNLLLIVLFAFLVPDIFAWGVEIGYQRLMPKLGTKEQEYKDQTGAKQSFKPKVEEAILGQSFTIGLKLAEYLIQYEMVDYSHSATIPAAVLGTPLDTEADSNITEKRLGVSYHLERELAGIFLGAGFSAVEEQLVSSDNEWNFSGNSIYLKYGIDLMVLDIFKVRAEQVHFRIGAHNALINSFGVVFFF